MKFWLARDKNKELYLHIKKPYKNEKFEFWDSSSGSGTSLYLGKKIKDLNNIKWTDKEPIEIELIINTKPL